MKEIKEICVQETEYTPLLMFHVHVGTTWLQEIVPLIKSEGDLTPVQTIPNWDRVPWLEGGRARMLNLEERPSPRIFATHFNHNMMPESFFKVKPKVSTLIFVKSIFTLTGKCGS